MADNEVKDGGQHTRMLSGDLIWCGVCGSYADVKVSGLTDKCTGRHTGPWKGGGKRGQLNDLRKNRHPRNRSQLPPPIPESTLALDDAAMASHTELHEAENRKTRYSAKDKAMARANASNPLAALTEEKRQWINNKRAEAIQRATRRRTQLELPMPSSSRQLHPSWSQRIRESVRGKRARHTGHTDPVSCDTNATGVMTGSTSGTDPASGNATDTAQATDANAHNDPMQHDDDDDDDITRCKDCGALQKWHHCGQCDAVQ